MIKKRLLGMVPESMRYIGANVILQWVSLVANIVMMMAVTGLFAALYEGAQTKQLFFSTAAIAICALMVRAACAVLASKMAFLSSKTVKRVLREQIYQKLLGLGSSYKEQVQTSGIVQVAVEGVDQLETYFGSYMPQFFYAMLAPLTLFVVLCRVSMVSAVVLLICVPLIPVAIALVQTWAKKLLSRYWGKYTALGDTFLENLQGLTTLKIYSSDAWKNEEMNEKAEDFRKITMKVLTMQLNSITIMDFIAYGGAALGMVMAVTQFKAGHVDMAGCLLIILLSADFFIPMRQLGSFFHVAMNGMAASDRIFELIDMPDPDTGSRDYPQEGGISIRGLDFSYEKDREILHGINIDIGEGKFTAIVGESGCGKSTIAGILTGRNKYHKGSVSVGKTELSEISEAEIAKNITYVSHQSYLFKGTVRDNLLMGCPKASDERLWEVLEQVKLSDFVRSEKGLDTFVAEKGGNLSGGQCQRLALARALLHDSRVYIFDEATSNIDIESENDIMKQIHAMAGKKTVLLISHRLANTAAADRIYVMEKGKVCESGTHSELFGKGRTYAGLWDTQQQLEKYTMNQTRPGMGNCGAGADKKAQKEDADL